MTKNVEENVRSNLWGRKEKGKKVAEEKIGKKIE